MFLSSLTRAGGGVAEPRRGHCGEVWVTLGALGQQTRRVWMGPTVTCPTIRYNPVVVAEAFATLSQLYPGRIFLGLGSGEALNEQAATGPAQIERRAQADLPLPDQQKVLDFYGKEVLPQLEGRSHSL
jgi:alkanesulfonate monooxygenase SsuD/methylene tetrahydromethanopterin reductase-like flavin-dependent oxidoreductase (luciferase family)